MKKCDFCSKSLPNGKCWWKTIAREDDCKKSIELMVKAMQNNNDEKYSDKHKRLY